eukprot:421017_1
MSPSNNPSFSPTKTPTNNPTSTPSIFPTNNPSNSPTHDAYEMSKLYPNDSNVNDWFGYGVGIENDKAIIGSQGNDEQGIDAGAAYYFQYDPTNNSWMQQQKILPNDGVATNYFGRSVAMDSDRVLIGAPGFNNFQGAAYIFRYNNISLVWEQEAKLVANDGKSGDQFTSWFSVALQNGRAVIGALYADVAGSAYVFEYDNDTNIWKQTAKLTPSDGQEGHRFGVSVALDKDNIVVGDDGNASVYIYTLDDNGSWSEQFKLLGDGGNFGYSVAIYRDYILVGAPSTSTAYFFHYNLQSDEWNQIQEIYGNGSFGARVRLNGQVAIIGSPSDYNSKGIQTGSISIFMKNQNNGLFEHKSIIAPENGKDYDGFTNGLEFKTNNIIAGAYYDDDNGNKAGAAYIIRNHNDCNETKTEIIDKLYLINWEWTVCHTLSPTAMPTTSPTLKPTRSPLVANQTHNPSNDPTQPTLAPSFAPSTPSTPPTLAPTAAPSMTPTLPPSVATLSPSNNPTLTPSIFLPPIFTTFSPSFSASNISTLWKNTLMIPFIVSIILIFVCICIGICIGYWCNKRHSIAKISDEENDNLSLQEQYVRKLTELAQFISNNDIHPDSNDAICDNTATTQTITSTADYSCKTYTHLDTEEQMEAIIEMEDVM